MGFISGGQPLYTIIISGENESNADRGFSYVEVITGDFGKFELPNLLTVGGHSLAMHNGALVSCGGHAGKNYRDSFGMGLKSSLRCLQLDAISRSWKFHSVLNEDKEYMRTAATAVTTKAGTFLLGFDYPLKLEHLPEKAKKWRQVDFDDPDGNFLGLLNHTSAVVHQSNQIVWIFGPENVFLLHLVKRSISKLASKLNVPRYNPRCSYLPNTKKIIITGGTKWIPGPDGDGDFGEILDSTEIFDTEDFTITMASPMNHKRDAHGIGTITIQGEDRVAVFGGTTGSKWNRGLISLDNLDLELYNSQTDVWELSKIKLKENYDEVTCVTVKLGEILSKM